MKMIGEIHPHIRNAFDTAVRISYIGVIKLRDIEIVPPTSGH